MKELALLPLALGLNGCGSVDTSEYTGPRCIGELKERHGDDIPICDEFALVPSYRGAVLLVGGGAVEGFDCYDPDRPDEDIDMDWALDERLVAIGYVPGEVNILDLDETVNTDFAYSVELEKTASTFGDEIAEAYSGEPALGLFALVDEDDLNLVITDRCRCLIAVLGDDEDPQVVFPMY